eukprot:scaffold2879_cov269-Prasinococcus_capsulatus_cf.AAC.12
MVQPARVILNVADALAIVRARGRGPVYQLEIAVHLPIERWQDAIGSNLIEKGLAPCWSVAPALHVREVHQPILHVGQSRVKGEA